MRLCNLFLLPAAGESSPWKSEGAAGRASSGAERRLLAGLATPRVWGTLLVSHAADKLIAVVSRHQQRLPALRWTGRTRDSPQPPASPLRAKPPGTHERLCPEQEVPVSTRACPEEPHAEAAVPSLRPACARASRPTARPEAPRGFSHPHGAHPREGSGMPVGAQCALPGVLPGRGYHRGGGDTERTREKQKAPSSGDRLAQGVQLILKNEVKPHCSQGDHCFNPL